MIGTELIRRVKTADGVCWPLTHLSSRDATSSLSKTRALSILLILGEGKETTNERLAQDGYYCDHCDFEAIGFMDCSQTRQGLELQEVKVQQCRAVPQVGSVRGEVFTNFPWATKLGLIRAALCLAFRAFTGRQTVKQKATDDFASTRHSYRGQSTPCQ